MTDNFGEVAFLTLVAILLMIILLFLLHIRNQRKNVIVMETTGKFLESYFQHHCFQIIIKSL